MFGHDNQHNEGDQKDQAGAAVTTVPVADNDLLETAADELGGYAATPVAGNTDSAATPVATDIPTNDLLDIKQQALQALSPLVGHLDQTPEEQFRTIMMLIQASDNHSLIQMAYEAAQKIGNEKERAQALLDIVNEINYFTQQSQTQA